MSKIFFKAGVMGSGKTLDLLRVAYDYREKGHEVLLYKPQLDTREGSGECIIRSRADSEEKAFWIRTNDLSDVRMDLDIYKIPSVIIVDEAQFLTKEQVDNFQKICYNYNIPIIFYGLKTTFQGELFEGSKRIIEICDKVEEFKSMCHCGDVARQNARVVDGVMTKDGDVIAIGGNELYVAVCNKCFLNGRVSE